jgi:hypothetical protein
MNQQACAQPYFIITPNYSTFAGCDVRDVACVCASQQFIFEISCCISKSCSSGDQESTSDFATNLCSQVSIPGTPPLPTVASCPTNTTSSTSTYIPATSVTSETTVLAYPTVTAAGYAKRNPTIRGRVVR